METGHKILVMAHGHPDFSPGGGELAAYSLFRGYAVNPYVQKAWFLARIAGDANGRISRHAENEYLWDQSLSDDFFMRGRNLWSTIHILPEFLRSMQPDIVHLHHAVHMGYEILQIIRNTLPQAHVYFTLHEFIPICHNTGQMVTTDGNLCRKSGLNACHACFPQKSVEEFWLREQRFKHLFRHVDAFFAPSSFLKERYVQWGMPEEKIVVLPNGLREIAPCPTRDSRDGQYRRRFGFFGQFRKLKGLEVLLRALDLIKMEDRAGIVLEAYGTALSGPDKAYVKNLKRKYSHLVEDASLRWAGPYTPDEIHKVMSSVDWVAMPSLWWENSPLVIQEAFACQRPVLASDLGGMAENVRHGVDGLLVAPGNAHAWADTLLACARDNELWNTLRGNIQRPVNMVQCAAQHLEAMA